MPYLGLFLIFLWMGILVAATVLLHKKAGVPTFYTRKLLHIGTAFVWIIGCLVIGNTWHMFIPNTLSFVAIAASYFLPPIAGIEEKAAEGEPKNYGTLYFAVSTMLITACNFSDFLYPCAGLAFCALAFGDGLAAICGRLASRFRCNPALCGKKTLVGLLACYAVTLAVASLFNWAFGLGFSLLTLLGLSGLVSILELYTPYGLDNISIPLFTVLLAAGVRMDIVPGAVLFVCAISPLFAIVALSKKVFTPVAAAGAFVLLVTFAWFSDYIWVINIFLGYGFILGAKLVRHAVIKRKQKQEGEGHSRGLKQLLSNLAFPLILMAIYAVTDKAAVAVGAFASFACAISDSMASDIGVLQKGKPFDICRLKPVEPGVSGGVSLLGSSMAVLAAVIHAAICFYVADLSFLAAVLVGGAALFGVFTDSVLGSLLQAKYRCDVCGKQLETPVCCGKRAQLVCGCRTIDNNTVNIIANGGAAIVGIIVAIGVM